MFWGKPPVESDAIGGDRRQDRRYHLQLELKWKLIRRRRVLDTGIGQTIDVSSGGIRFDAGRHLPEGLNVELSVAWPVLLHNIVIGKIVRCDGRHVAMQTVQHEFRTVGTAAVSEAHPMVAAAAAHDTTILSGREMFATFGKL